MNYKERQDWLKARYPLTVVTDRYSGTYSGAAYLAFPLDFDEVPEDVNGDDTECAYFWPNYAEPVGKGISLQEAIDDLVAQMQNEDKDEKIREEMIKHFQNILKGRADTTTREDTKRWLAYLEKQKEMPTDEEMLRTLRTEYEKGVADTIAKYEQKERQQIPTMNGDVDLYFDEWNQPDLPAGFYFIDKNGKKYYSDTLKCGNLKFIANQKEQKFTEIDERKIIDKHITEDFLSSEVNKRLKECGWYVTDEKPTE